MKDSQSKWIGDIPSHWEIAKVKHYFYRSKEEAHQDNPVVLSLARSGVKVRDLSKNEGQLAESYYNYNLVEPGDLLLNPMDLYSGANCSISKVKGVISQAYMNLRNWGTANPVYYDYYFKTQYWSMALFAHGEGVSFDNRWTLNAEALFNYPIPVPPLSEQQRIANYIGSKCADIDNILEKTRLSIGEYKKLRQVVITKAVTKGIRGPRPMKSSGVEWIGDIPEDWARVKIGQLFNYIGGNAFDSATFNTEGYGQVLRIGNIKNDKIDFESSPVYISKNIATFSEKVRVREGYILFTMTGTKGKGDYFYTTCVSDSDVKDKPLYINQRVGAFSAKSGVFPDYYNYLFKVEKIRRRIFLYETGTANQGNIGIDSISRVLVQFPSYDEQQEISAYLDQICSDIDSIIEKKENLITELEAYKRSLIYEYVTGKKEVTA